MYFFYKYEELEALAKRVITYIRFIHQGKLDIDEEEEMQQRILEERN
jgi:hypothetical protein